MAGFTLAGIVLQPDCIWIDEFNYTPIKQNVTHSLGGTQYVQESSIIIGRPITLELQWIDKTTLDLLTAQRDVIDNTMSLVIDDGRTFSVKFRHAEKAPIDATPVLDYPNYDPEDYFSTVIKLFEV